METVRQQIRDFKAANDVDKVRKGRAGQGAAALSGQGRGGLAG